MDATELTRYLSFAAIAEQGSLTRAAQALGTSKSVISSHLRALEEHLGVRLIERTTRRLTLTQVGEEVLAGFQGVRTAIAGLQTIAESHRLSPVGTLRVTTTYDMGARLVGPVLATLGREHPELRIDLVCDDRRHDLVAERFDAAVRVGRVDESGHFAHRLAESLEVLVASPEVALRLGALARPRELQAESWVVHSALGRAPTWRFRGPGSSVEEVVVRPRALANSVEGVRMMLLASVGIGVLPLFMVADELARGRLVRLLPAWSHRRVVLYALLPSRQKPARVRLFLEALRREASELGHE
jgi:DNA-binding transcriptional LysR family regulator